MTFRTPSPAWSETSSLANDMHLINLGGGGGGGGGGGTCGLGTVHHGHLITFMATTRARLAE